MYRDEMSNECGMCDVGLAFESLHAVVILNVRLMSSAVAQRTTAPSIKSLYSDKLRMKSAYEEQWTDEERTKNADDEDDDKRR